MVTLQRDTEEVEKHCNQKGIKTMGPHIVEVPSKLEVFTRGWLATPSIFCHRRNSRPGGAI